jgi:cytochrome P450
MMVAFTRKSINEMHPKINTIADNTLAKLKDAKEIDLVDHYASPIPALTIMHLLGVPIGMLGEFKSWSDDMSKFIGGSRNDKQKYEKASRGCRKMVSFFREIIDERRKNPSDGFLMDLIDASVENDKFSDDELIATCMLILFAGHETTTNLISNGILTLIKNQSELNKLLENPQLLDLTIEEIMRFDGPTNSLVRNVEIDHELHGKKLKKGDRIFAMVSSANRDELIFDKPNIFKIDRSPNRHLTFGYGPHLCIGAALAREEGRIAIKNFFNNYPKTNLKAENSYEWIDAMVPRGLKNLNVKLI